MKKFVALLFSIVLLLSSCAQSGSSLELSSGIDYLRQTKSMHKCLSPYEPTVFNGDEFDSLIGQKVSYIVMSSLPSTEFGVLSLRGKPVMAGQTVAASSLGLLTFTPLGEAGNTDSFTFYCRDGGFAGREITCSLLLTDNLSSPTAQNVSFDAIAGIPRNCVISTDYEIELQSYPTHGSIRLSGGSAIYTASEDYDGLDSFVYVAKDDYGVSPSATVYISVAANEKRLTFCDVVDDDCYDAARMCLQSVMTYLQKDGKYYFEPTETVSRIDFAVMLMDALGIGPIYSVSDTVFLDDGGLTLGRRSYLAKAVEIGLVDVGDGYFEPTKPATRSYAASLLGRALSLPDAVKTAAMTDAAAVTDGEMKCIQKVISAGLMSTSNGYFYPSLELTRLDAAELLCAAVDYKAKTDP